MGEWRDTTLGDILTLQRGFDLPRDQRRSGKVPVIASTGIVGFHDGAKVHAPGVVIGRSGSLGGGQYVTEDFWPLNTTLWVKDFKGNSERFCYYLIKSLDLGQFNAGSGVPTLNRNHVHPLPVRCPPVNEQKAIAHILGTLDDKIGLNRRMNETLEGIARTIFKSWFVDFDPVRAKAEGRETGLPKEIEDLFPASFEESELGEIPKGWKVGSVSDLVDITSGKRPSSRSPSRTADMSIPLWGGNGPMAFVDTALYEQPILLTGRVGTLGSVFRITEPCWPSDNTLVMLPKDQAALPYVYLALLRIDFSALNRGSTQPLLAQSDLKKQRLICPGLPIIKAFHAMVENCFRWQDIGARQGLRLRDTRQVLTPRLLAGVIRIPEGTAT